MVIVFGSINLDLIFNLPNIPTSGQTVLSPATRIEPGGKGANQALAARRDGAEVVMVGAVGRDALADGALALLRSAALDLSRIRHVDHSTGCAAISVDPDGHNAIAVGSGANLAAAASQVEDALLRPGATLLLQMEVPPAENAALIARAKAGGARVILNLAPAAALPEDALRALDVLVVNEAEAAWLARHLCCEPTAAALRARLERHQADWNSLADKVARENNKLDRADCSSQPESGLAGITMILTRGSEGVEVAHDGTTWHQPAVAIRAVDTTAAGDVFAGVLAHRLDRGEAMPDAIRRATLAASLSCTRPGSQSSIPTAVETDAFASRAGEPLATTPAVTGH